MTYDDNTPLFPISVAGKMVGVTTKMLRIYEEEGLLSPNRTPSTKKVMGRRLYSQNDIKYITILRELMQAGFTIGNLNSVYAYYEKNFPGKKLSKKEYLEDLNKFIKARKEN